MVDIWVVEHGEYSENTAECAFSTEEAAKAWCDEMNRRCCDGTGHYEYDYKRVDLDPVLPSEVKKVLDEEPVETPEERAEKERAEVKRLEDINKWRAWEQKMAAEREEKRAR